GVSGNLTANVISNISIEDGTNGLNQWAESGVGGYKFMIQPIQTGSPTQWTISGGYNGTDGTNTRVFPLNGADKGNINRSFGGYGQYLLFRNNNSSDWDATLSLMNDATNDSIQNSIFETGTVVLGLGTAMDDGVIYLGGTTGTRGNDDNVFYNCDIRSNTA